MAGELWLVAGLGNPGDRYERTRHNAGAMVVERLAGRLGVRLKKVRFLSLLAAESKHGPTFAAAPNFAFELAVDRGRPDPGEDLDLTNVVSPRDGLAALRLALALAESGERHNSVELGD